MRFVSRAQWGARHPKGSIGSLSAKGGVALHYEGVNTGTYDHSRCDDKVRVIQKFHMDSRGWLDIAYTAVVCQHGFVFQGRWLNVRTAAQGTNDGNRDYYAVCYLGGPKDPLTDAAKVAIRDVCKYLQDRGGAGGRIRPHSFFHATGCPGGAIRDWIKAGCPVPASAAPKVSARPKPVVKRPLVFLGMKNPGTKRKPNPHVQYLQQRLRRHGYVEVKADGVMGKVTDRYLRAFQKRTWPTNHAWWDGVAGEHTWKALEK